MPMTIHSSAFDPEQPIPRRHTCEGDDVSPPLHWSEVPGGTRALALIVDDPDAPDPEAPQMTYVHWVVYNLPADLSGLEEDAAGRLPPDAREGRNDFERTRYGGPCPPVGRHRYFFKLYALDTELPDLGGPTKDALLDAMTGHVLAEAQLMGTYRKGD